MNRLAFGSSVAALLLAARRSAAAGTRPVGVLYAGSLVTVMENAIVPAARKRGLDVRGEGKGSLALAQLVSSGLRAPDVFISADAKILDGFLRTSGEHPAIASWYATFATTRLVIGYSPKSAYAADFAAAARGAKPLEDVLVQQGVRLGRTDPRLDPKGYRSIIAAKLLEGKSRRSGFARRLIGDDSNADQVLPEETLLARLEAGDVDAAFLYATEAVSRRVPAIELPPEANLGDVARAKHYATASVTIDGIERRGAPAEYALTIPKLAPDAGAAVAFVAFLFSHAGAGLLRANGVTPIHPVYSGDAGAVPAGIGNAGE